MPEVVVYTLGGSIPANIASTKAVEFSSPHVGDPHRLGTSHNVEYSQIT